MDKKKLLWVDDEVDLLKPYFLFLEAKNYEIQAATSGIDAIEMVKNDRFDVILLDEMMPGKDGLETLVEIKAYDPSIKVIMVTKSEEESIMEEAIGQKIDDYLIKPVNPTQVLMSLKKILEATKINTEKIQSSYLQELQGINQNLLNEDYGDSGWLKLYKRLSELSLQLDETTDETLWQTFTELKKQSNAQFCNYVASYYEEWVHTTRDDRPQLSVDIFKEVIAPKLKTNKKVIFLVLDCLRYDHWLVMESVLHDYFYIEHSPYYSILPTSTAYARNALFSGSFPDELNQILPEFWKKAENDLNNDEEYFISQSLKRNGIRTDFFYKKCKSVEDIKHLQKSMDLLKTNSFSTIVVNSLDMITHTRAESQVLKEIVPDDKAYRKLMKSWFEASPVLSILKELSQMDCEVVITTDHGSIQVKRDVKVHGDRNTSTNIRYKHGKSLDVSKKFAVTVKDPHRFRLPHHGFSSDYIISKEDYYFIYPTQYHKFAALYNESFQHGGISLDEMVVPLAILKGK